MTLKVGDRFESNNCGELVVIGYKDYLHVAVRFVNTGFETIANADHIRRGEVKDPMHPSIYDIGFIGIGKYPSGINGKKSNMYICWYHMLNRCYNSDYKDYPRYGGRGIIVDNFWHNFQNYAKWYQGNYKEGFEIDKDLRQPDSKKYSQDTCEFIPKVLNTLLISCNTHRGNYPVGVSFHKRYGKYLAQCRNTEKGSVYLGYFSSSEGAFGSYKTYKEAFIKEQAIKYYKAGDISEQVYNTLMEWTVTPYPE